MKRGIYLIADTPSTAIPLATEDPEQDDRNLLREALDEHGVVFVDTEDHDHDVMSTATPAEEDYRALMATADHLNDDDLADDLRKFAMTSGGRHDALPGTPDVGDIHAASVLDEGGEAVVAVKGTDGAVRIHVPEGMVEPFRHTVEEAGRVYDDAPTDDTLIG